jgi:VIT1/CCC1 family predicted Fe2+/Mn2+ transporter
MKHSLQVGFSFGLTSGIITTLGLIVGLNSSTHSTLVIVGGILIIAIADAFSDALGIHISEESEAKHTRRQIWESTFSTFLTKFTVAITFIFPMVLLELPDAVIVSVVWGILLLGLFSYSIAKKQKADPFRAVMGHLLIAVLVIAATHFVGSLVASAFG